MAQSATFAPSVERQLHGRGEGRHVAPPFADKTAGASRSRFKTSERPVRLRARRPPWNPTGGPWPAGAWVVLGGPDGVEAAGTVPYAHGGSAHGIGGCGKGRHRRCRQSTGWSTMATVPSRQETMWHPVISGDALRKNIHEWIVRP